MFVRGERVMDIPKTYKGKFLGLNCLGHKKYEPDYCFASDVKSYIDEAQAEIEELVDMLEELRKLQEHDYIYSPDELTRIDEIIKKHKGK
jgi:hypothetical protein